MESEVRSNVEYWDGLAEIHFKSAAYPVEGVIAGRSTLRSVEIDLLGDCQDSRIIHSHCHIGLDTISISRICKDITGIDSSPQSIAIAKEIAEAAEVSNCTFLVADSRTDLEQLPEASFDIYFASYGILVWVDNLSAWFACAQKLLKSGGCIILIDEHPVAGALDGDKELEELTFSAPYFEARGPYVTHNKTSYTGDDSTTTTLAQTKWPHSVSEILLHAQNANMTLLDFQEYPMSHYAAVANMTEASDGYFYHDLLDGRFPFMFSAVFKRISS